MLNLKAEPAVLFKLNWKVHSQWQITIHIKIYIMRQIAPRRVRYESAGKNLGTMNKINMILAS